MPLVPATSLTGRFNQGSPLNQMDVASERFIDTETGSIFRVGSEGRGLKFDGQVSPEELERVRAASDTSSLFEPSALEQELMSLQMDILRKQLALQEAAQAKEADRERIFQDILGMPLAQFEATQAKRAADLEGLLYERQTKALKGELPISAATERELQRGEQLTREELGRGLGPNYALSSAGIESLGRQQETAAMVREAERRGVIAEGQGPIYASQIQSRNLLARSPYTAPPELANLIGQTRQDRYSQVGLKLQQDEETQDLLGALRQNRYAGGGPDYGGIGAGLGAVAGGILGGFWNFGAGAPAGAEVGARIGSGAGRAAGGYYARSRRGY